MPATQLSSPPQPRRWASASLGSVVCSEEDDGLPPTYADPARLRALTDDCNELLSILSSARPSGARPPDSGPAPSAHPYAVPDAVLSPPPRAGGGPGSEKHHHHHHHPRRRSRHRRVDSTRPSFSAPLTHPPERAARSRSEAAPRALLARWLVFVLERRAADMVVVERFEGTREPQRPAVAAAAREAVRCCRAAVHAVGRLQRDGEGASSSPGADAAETLVLEEAVSCELAALAKAESAVLCRLVSDAAVCASAQGRHWQQQQQQAQRESAAAAGLTPRESLLSKELAAAAEMLEESNANNARLVAALQAAKAEGTALAETLRRAEADKSDIARHYDAVAAENARLQLRLQGLAAAHASEAAAREERLRREGRSEEYARLQAQVARQTAGLRGLRADLEAAEKQKTALAGTVESMRAALVRHRSVIDLLLRHQGGDKPARVVSPTLIEDYLAGTARLPHSDDSLFGTGA